MKPAHSPHADETKGIKNKHMFAATVFQTRNTQIKNEANPNTQTRLADNLVDIISVNVALRIGSGPFHHRSADPDRSRTGKAQPQQGADLELQHPLQG